MGCRKKFDWEQEEETFRKRLLLPAPHVFLPAPPQFVYPKINIDL